MLVVIDTNVLVSALLSRQGSPAKVMALLLNGDLLPVFDYQIIHEYKLVLGRPKFGFEEWEVKDVIDFIESVGISIVAVPTAVDFTDEDDRKFYEAARHCQAILITGNKKLYPADDSILTVNEFLDLFSHFSA